MVSTEVILIFGEYVKCDNSGFIFMLLLYILAMVLLIIRIEQNIKLQKKIKKLDKKIISMRKHIRNEERKENLQKIKKKER